MDCEKCGIEMEYIGSFEDYDESLQKDFPYKLYRCPDCGREEKDYYDD